MNGNALVGPEWLSQRLNDPTVRVVHIDWEGTEAFEQGHVPGAIGRNWKEWLWDPAMREFPSPSEFARRCEEAGISNDTTVVFYGEPVQFGTYGWWVFKLMNHRDVRMLDGGRARWVAEGHPLEIGAGRTPAGGVHYDPPTSLNNHMRANREEILAHLDDFASGERAILLDHRSPEEFRGQLVNAPGKPDVGAERYGRIPGARHLHFADLLREDNSFKSPQELKDLFEQVGATSEREIISYCRLSHRATLAYFVMTELLGYDRVRSYDGSWTEWGNIVGMPIER